MRFRGQAEAPGGPQPLRQNRLPEDVSRTTSTICLLGWRQNDGGPWGKLKRRWRQQDSVGIGLLRLEAADLKTPQPADLRRHGRGAAALQQVDPEVVVVALPAHEAYDPACLGHELHAERFVEGLARIEVADVQVHVAEHSAGRELGLRWR